MSKRFGRNQKRRLVQELAQQQAVNTTLVKTTGIQISEISRLESRLRAAEAVLGVDNPAFPANCLEALGPTKYDPHATIRMRNGSYAHPMTMKRAEGAALCHREQALHLYPREVLARGIAEKFTHMVLDELNKLGCAMATEYPEWVHHVGMGYQDGRRNQAWCGSSDKPFFVDPGHAALNGKHGGRLVACPECVAAIHEALCNGHGDINAGEENGE